VQFNEQNASEECRGAGAEGGGESPWYMSLFTNVKIEECWLLVVKLLLT